MDTDQFLARVVAPGNFLVIGCARKKTDSGPPFFNTFMPRADLRRAAGFIKWATEKMGWDAYHAMASYRDAANSGTDARGDPKYIGRRDQKNAEQLKAFWIDLDVKRAGDKKDPAGVHASRAEAMGWLKTFIKAMGLPLPNLAVNSGYGMHVYWVLEDALATADWQPYADALKAALVAHKFKGDPGISADAARVLRPPNSNNMKSGQPVAVEIIPRLSAGDYPNPLILTALQPYVGVLAAKTHTQTVGAASALGGAMAVGGSVVQGVFSGKPNMNAAAQANIAPSARPREMARIATQCEQIKLSLANHGKGENRDLWLLGNLTLAHFCTDGAAYVHLLGDGDPRYSHAGTEAAVAQVAKEHRAKGMGPPRCSHYETQRQSVCTGCPHYTKINSPWDLGVDDGDLPDNYRRGKRGIEVRIKVKNEQIWVALLAGDVHTPLLDELPIGGYALTFVYERVPGSPRTIRVAGKDLADLAQLFRLLEQQFLVLMPGTEQHFRGFVLGWIDKLRENRAERTEIIHPFGWSYDRNGATVGFAVGGTLYTPDGREVATPGGDAMLVQTYRPAGTLANWQSAASFVLAGRTDLQLLVAASFGAPLMTFTGHAGLVISAWSRQSAVGKSSAIRVGQSVWSAAISMNSIDDTNNFVLKKVADVRSMPCYWDEMKVGADNSDKMVSLALSLSQGKGKGRMNADTSLREVGEWDTILVAASNFPLMDHIVAKTDGTDAGAVRLFEFAITIPPTPDTSQAARIIALTKTNYGVAGRVYAKWLAANHDKCDKLVCLLKDQLNAELGAEQAERFYIAGMAASLAGARIAMHLGLCQFDMAALKAFFCEEFFRLRLVRQTNVVVGASGYDLNQILGSFMADTLAHKMITRWFAGSGPKKLPVDFIQWYPQDRRRVDVHIAQDDKIMRIDRSAFLLWCRKRNYPASDIVTAMITGWGALAGRRTLASGTGFAGGQVHCIDIPLVLPDLQGYLYVDPVAAAYNNASALGVQPVLPTSPAAAVKAGKGKSEAAAATTVGVNG